MMVKKLLGEQLQSISHDIMPEADDTVSLGAESKEFKNLYVDDTAYIDNIHTWVRGNHTSVSSAYTALLTDDVILGDTSGGAFTITLPKVADAPTGKIYTFIRDGSGTNALTIDGDGSETIDGAATHATMDAQYDSITIINTGTEWIVIASKIA